jgi:hypothetical protein
MSLIECVISHALDRTVVRTQFLPICLEQILPIFQEAPPHAKSPKVLSLFGNLAKRCTREIDEVAETIFTGLYHPVLNLIREDFESNENLRPDFFEFVGALVRYSIGLVLSLPEEELELFIKGIQWGAQHPQHEISEKCTMYLTDLVTAVGKGKKDEVAAFVEQYGVALLKFAFEIMTDTIHKYALAQQSNLIRWLLLLPPMEDHAAAIVEEVATMYPMREPYEFGEFFDALQGQRNNERAFCELCKDFLIEVTHILPSDPDLKRLERRRRAEARQEMDVYKADFPLVVPEAAGRSAGWTRAFH